MNLRVLVDIGHPAHVHLFKHIIWKINAMGGKTCITTRKKDVATELMDAYGLQYHVIGHYSNRIDHLLSLIITTNKLLKIARTFNPHIFLSVGSVHAIQVARILNRVSVSLIDTEGSVLEGLINRILASKIYTPQPFRTKMGGKQVHYNGYHEMSYLLPKYFRLDSSILPKYGLSLGDSYSIVRLVAWGAPHDWRQKGMADIDGIITYLEKYGKVLLSVESRTKPSAAQNKVRISPEDMHTMLAFASLYVGEGATMASECASLGTPAIYVNSQRAGIVDTLVRAGLEYQVVPSEKTYDEIIKRIDEVFKKPPDYFRKKSQDFLIGKIDVVDFIVKDLLDLARKKYLL
jgi:predicted glycosyltransferase